MTASTPEDAIRVALEGQVENLILDLDFGVQRQSGVAIAQRVLEARSASAELRTRILFRTVHAGDPGYLHQIQKFVETEGRPRPAVWGFLDKGSVPKRLAQNTVEQVFVYELSFTDMFSQQLKNSPSKDLSDLEFTMLIYLCLGVTNDGLGWLIGASRQSVERILGGLYKKLKIPSRRDAAQGRADAHREPHAPVLRGRDAAARQPASAERGGRRAPAAREEPCSLRRPALREPGVAGGRRPG